TEQRLGKLPHDPGPAEAWERVGALQRRDHRAVGIGVGGTMVVRHDDVEPEALRLRDLVDRRDAAVDGQDELEPLAGEAGERLAVEAVALLEPRRQMPRRL